MKQETFEHATALRQQILNIDAIIVIIAKEDKTPTGLIFSILPSHLDGTFTEAVGTSIDEMVLNLLLERKRDLQKQFDDL